MQVYVCGQPTQQGFEAILEKVTASYPKEAPIVWINMRQVRCQDSDSDEIVIVIVDSDPSNVNMSQEPSVYVNGMPMCARPPNKVVCDSLELTRPRLYPRRCNANDQCHNPILPAKCHPTLQSSPHDNCFLRWECCQCLCILVLLLNMSRCPGRGREYPGAGAVFSQATCTELLPRLI